MAAFTLVLGSLICCVQALRKDLPRSGGQEPEASPGSNKPATSLGQRGAFHAYRFTQVRPSAGTTRPKTEPVK
jgi:hypothetical protein